MVQLYRTSGGLYYKQLGGGRKVRIGRAEFLGHQQGGAVVKKTKARKSPKKASRKASSRKLSRKVSSRKTASKKGLKSSSKKSDRPVMNYTPAEQACIDYAQAKIAENVNELKAGKFKHIAQAVAVSYSQAREAHAECADFYDREKARKDAMKAERRAAKGNKKRSTRRKSKSGSRKRSSPKVEIVE